jgi:hypothetical protein
MWVTPVAFFAVKQVLARSAHSASDLRHNTAPARLIS